MPEQRYRIRFLPEGVSVEVDANTSLLNAARNVGIDIMSVCGGEGTCGKCLVRVLAGRVRQSDRVAILNPALRAEGYTLACQTFPLENLTVEVPVESRLDSTDVVIRHTEVEVPEYEVGLETYQHSPLACRMQLTLRPPTLTENASDLTRLLAGLRRVTNDARTSHVTNTKGCIFGGTERPIGIALSALRELPNALRDGDWKVTVTLVNCCDRWEVTRVTSGHDAQPAYGAAIDVGTTTITVYLVNMHTGETVQRLATYNEQFVYGEDVITRIVYATRNEDGLEHLRRAALRTINQLLDHAINAMKISRDDIACAVVAGNTVMTHLLLGIEPKYIRLEPYIPAAVTYPPIKAREVGIGIHQEGYVFTFPCVASYVGGDIVAGALVSGMGLRSEVGLFVDIGTNGEMVLGNKDYLVTCACSAGPAFEGSGITCGMRSVRGAIESVEVNSSDLQILVKTIGNARPIGICGSGLVDLLATLRNAGIIDLSGNFLTDLKTPRLRTVNGDYEFVIVWASEAGINRDITITQADIKNLMRSKAAIYAGIRCMLNAIGMGMEDIERIYVAGAFGSYLNVRRAVEIGLLPDLPRERFVVLGNSSVKGARLALLSQQAWDEAHALASRMTYLELSVEPSFMNEFISANFLPHTNLELFPSVQQT